jgi:photosystem II stability/assembly factor-like uncharacterized protein
MTDQNEINDPVHWLAASPQFERDGVCFSARHTGLYRSSDGGLSWEPAFVSLNLTSPLSAFTVALSPDYQTDRTVYVGVSGAVLSSRDGGESWQIHSLRTPPPLVCCLTPSPDFTRDGVILAGTAEDGILRSGDGGRRWEWWNFGLLDLHVLCLGISPDFAADQTVFSGTESGLFRSTNGGRAWREVTLAPGISPVTCLALSPQFASDGVVFAGTEEDGLFYSSDRGGSWTRLGANIFDEPINGILLASTSKRPLLLRVLTSGGVFDSVDRGQSWKNDLEIQLGATITCGLAPGGNTQSSLILLGLANGQVWNNQSRR